MLTKNQFTPSDLRIPPQDLTAEQAVLGAVMVRPSALNEIADVISKDDFYAQKHKIIFGAMVALYERNEPIDAVSLSSFLKERNQLEQIGGVSYLAELAAAVPSSSNIAHYADTVQKKSALRRVIESADKILRLGYDESQSLDGTFDEVERTVFSLTNSFSKKKYTTIKDSLVDAWERFDKLNKSDHEIRGVPSGFRDLDAKLAGFQPSDLVILAARPSMGKTSLALDIARNSAKLGTPVAIFSMEMSSQQLVDRLISSESVVDSWKIRTGKKLTDEEFQRIQDAYGKLSNLPLYIDDEPGKNITQMRAVARRLKSEHNLGLIIVDYLQLMIPKRDSDSMVQQITEISRSLKGLARELDVPVIALSQLSRAVEQRGGRPRLSDLRDSGAIEQDADVVMFIHREQQEEGGGRKAVAEILIEKHRNGPTGKIDLYFNGENVSFTSMEKADFGGF